MNDEPLPCARCGHDIEKHHPNGPGRDHCHGQRATARTANRLDLERHERSGTPCDCGGFEIRRMPRPKTAAEVEENIRKAFRMGTGPLEP